MNHPIEAEEGILACCLLDENNIDVVAQSLESDALSDIRIAALWRLMLEMRNDGKPVDSITLISRVREANLEHECGGVHYIGELEQRVPSATNLSYYIDVVKEAYAHRHGLEALSEASLGLSGDLTAEQVFARLETTTESLKEKHQRGAFKRTLVDIVNKVIDDCEAAANGECRAIKTGFHYLDDKLGGGMHPKELIVIGARPSMGKSALAKDIAVYVAKMGTPIGVFSLEDPAEGFILRALSGCARVPARQIRRGSVPEEYYKRLVNWTGKLTGYPLFIEDESPMTCSALIARMGELKRKHGCKAFIIDYLQFITPDVMVDARDQQVAQISKALKSAAKRLDVPILALAQLNRDADTLKNGVHPIERHLGESSSIEKDADVIMMLHKGKDFEEDGDYGDINLHVLKQRNGPRYVNIPLTLMRQTVSFEEKN